MTGASAGAGGGPSSPAFRLCGEDGRAEWLRFYDLVEAQVEALAADRAHLGATRGEGEEAIPPADRLAELQEGDLEDVSACRGLLALRNTESKQVQDRLELGENTGDHEHIVKALRANLRKLKGAFETLLSKKDKDVYSVKDVLLNQFRTMQKDNTLFENKKLEAAQATEEAKKHQQNVQVLHVAAQNKDDEIGRLQAETLVAQQKLHEMDSLLKEKDESIEKLHAENIGVLAVKDFLWSQFQIKEQELLDYAMLLKNKEVAAAEATEEAKKHQQNVQALHVAAQNKDDEIGRLQAEALLAQQKLHEMDSLLKEKDESIEKLRAENIGVLAVKDFLWSQSQIKEQELQDYAMLLKNKEVAAAQATKAAQKLVKENCMMEAEVVDYGNKLLILEDKLKETHFLAKEKDDEIQELKNRQHEITSLKRKCASSLSNETSKKRRTDIIGMHIACIRRCKPGRQCLGRRMETPPSSGDFTASKLPSLKINPEAQAKRRKIGGSIAAPTVQEPEHAKPDSPAPAEARKNAPADAPQPSEPADNDMAIPEPNPSTAADDTTSLEVVVIGTGYHPFEPHVLTKHISKVGTCSPDKFEFEFSVLEKLTADELHAGYLNRLSTSRNMESKLVGMMKKKYEEALEAAESNLTGLRENVASQQAARAEAEEKCRVAVEELAKLQADFTAFKKTAESKETALTKRADDADQRLKLASEELQTLKRHISRMTSAIFGQRSRQLSSDSLLKLKAVYTLTEQLYCGTLCTIKAMLNEKSISKFMKGVIELLSTLPKQIDELKRSAVRKGAMAALSRFLAFAPELTAEEMIDGFPSKKDDGSEFTEADYVKCMKASRVLASTLVDEIDLSSYQAAYGEDSKRVRCLTFEARDLIPARRKPLFALEIDPSPFFDEAQFEALTNCNWDVDNLQIKEVEDPPQDDPPTN